jgi:Asp-tRNA(Asn)/Glu-tRNA(Gln) amidotransferase C subunit
MANEPTKLPSEESADNDAPVTREEFQQLMTQMSKMSKYIAKVEKLASGKGNQTVSESSDGNGNSEPQGLRERVEQLAKQQADILAQTERLQRGKLSAAVSRTLQKKGVPALLADDAAEVVLSRNRDKFGLNESEEAYFIHNDENINLDSWSSIFLASEKGAAYLPAKSGPQRIPLAGRKGGAAQVTITAEQLASGNYDPASLKNAVIAG